MTTYTLTPEITLVTLPCGKCGITFAVPQSFRDEKLETGQTFYCPNGHPRVFAETEATRLRRQLESVRGEAQRAYAQATHQRDQREAAERSNAVSVNPRSAVETAINTHYNPGLHAWGRATQGHIGAVIQNALGSIEYWTNPNNGNDGELIVHAPQPVPGWADQPVLHCPVAGGLCFEGHSTTAYRELILPLLQDDDGRGVLRLLRDTHDHYFRPAVAS